MMVPTSLLYPTEADRAFAVAALRMQIAGLQVAIRSGTTTASYDGKSVSYASFGDLQKALGLAVRELTDLLAPAGYRRPTAGFAVFNRGNR